MRWCQSSKSLVKTQQLLLSSSQSAQTKLSSLSALAVTPVDDRWTETVELESSISPNLVPIHAKHHDASL